MREPVSPVEEESEAALDLSESSPLQPQQQQHQNQQQQQPFSQKLVKSISNVCFSFFVLTVIIFTVAAVTYQPPDPWLQSSRALTHTLSSTLPNSTFATDDSILPTGEDVVNVSAANTTSASVGPIDSPVNTPAVALLNSSSCDITGGAEVNCSDPRVLLAIRRFNAGRALYRKSIIFLSYSVPVAGSKPGQCDAAWRFRNRREKSWRRYLDYRRFRLAANLDSCSYEIVSVGKFRSGANAAPQRSKPKATPSTRAAPAVPEVKDSEINDTIPVLPESDFKRGKYLYYARGGDYCKSMNQYLWSFLCGLGEAFFLNRTFVVDLNVCLSGAYTPSGKDEEGKDFRYYFDFEHLKESASVVEEQEFLHDWQQWDRVAARVKKAGRISVRKVPTYKITPMQLKRDRSTIIWRQFEGSEPENYWYRVCEGRAAKFVQRPWSAIWKSKRLMNIVTEIAGKMDWDYDSVHVVRGWKAANKEMYPNLDSDTSPEALVDKLVKLIPQWRNLYIATNEPFYNYFDKLRSHYNVHLLDDYKEMWGNKSEWYNETLNLNGGKPVEFDGYMRVAVDTEVFYRAKTRVETFNNLTRDCKDGVNTC